MIVVLFRSRLTDRAGEAYTAMDAEMDQHARAFPGFVDVKSFTAADGERLTVVWWADKDSLQVWAEDRRHRKAQAQGRADWYEYYKMDVAEVLRVSNFTRNADQVTPPTPVR